MVAQRQTKKLKQMNTLVINQIPFSEKGTCELLLNNVIVDRVDNNFDERYTQLHFAIAKCKHTFGDIDSIEYNVKEGCPTPYPLEDVLSMAQYFTIEETGVYRI